MTTSPASATSARAPAAPWLLALGAALAWLLLASAGGVVPPLLLLSFGVLGGLSLSGAV